MRRTVLPPLDPTIRLIEGDDGGGGTEHDDVDTEGKGGGDGGTDDATDDDGEEVGTGGTGDTDKPDSTDGAKPKAETFDRKYVEKLRDEAAKARRKGEEDREALVKALRKAIGDDADNDETDPAKLAESAVKERDDARTEVLASRRELAVVRAASGLGVDEGRLLDSRGFEKQLSALDPGDDKFADDVKALIKKTAEKDPALKARPGPGKPSNGERMGGESGLDGQLTRSQLKSMTPKQIEEAREAGKLRTLLGG